MITDATPRAKIHAFAFCIFSRKGDEEMNNLELNVFRKKLLAFFVAFVCIFSSVGLSAVQASAANEDYSFSGQVEYVNRKIPLINRTFPCVYLKGNVEGGGFGTLYKYYVDGHLKRISFRSSFKYRLKTSEMASASHTIEVRIYEKLLKKTGDYTLTLSVDQAKAASVSSMAAGQSEESATVQGTPVQNDTAEKASLSDVKKAASDDEDIDDEGLDESDESEADEAIADDESDFVDDEEDAEEAPAVRKPATKKSSTKKTAKKKKTKKAKKKTAKKKTSKKKTKKTKKVKKTKKAKKKTSKKKKK